MNVFPGRPFRPSTSRAVLALVVACALPLHANTTAQPPPLTQAWTTTSQITANDDWSGVNGIVGYLGQDITTGTGTDPQTLLGTSAVANDVDVIANLTATTSTAGGVGEFHTTSQAGAPGTDPTIGLQGSGTADAPHVILYVDSTSKGNITVSYNLRDIDCTADNAVQPVALQYRTSTSGNFTNVAAGYVADATTGPSLCTQVTAVSVQLPSAADNQANLQIRIMTTNAVGSDEWVGIDDISVTGVTLDPAPTVTSTNPADGATLVAVGTNLDVTFSEDVAVTSSSFGISCTSSGAHTFVLTTNSASSYTLNPDADFTFAESCTLTVVAANVSDTDTNDPSDTMTANYTATFSMVGAPTDPVGNGSATPSSVLPGGSTTIAVTVTPGLNPTSSGIAVTADLSPIGGSSTQTLYDDGAHDDGAAGDLTFAYTATVTGATVPGAKSIDWSVTDAEARSDAGTIALTVDAPALAIHDVQGSGSRSPYEGLVVKVTGIVTARKFNNGFFLQMPDAEVDADPATSEGIFVFTSSAPPADAAVGNKVTVQAAVQEFAPSQDPNQPPMTELVSPAVTLVSTGNPLPAPITITNAMLPANGTLEQLEYLEGMRVTVPELIVTAATGGSAVSTYTSSTSNGVFQGVLPGAELPFREPGIEVLDAIPAGTPANTPRFDGNPQRLRVDSDGQAGVTTKLEVGAGMKVQNITGVLDYGFRTHTILPDSTPTVTGVAQATAVRNPLADEFTIGHYNLERFYDDVDDPALSSGNEPVLTGAQFDHRLTKASLAIRTLMKSPDIVGIIEIEGINALRELAEKVNADTVAAGLPNPFYVPYLYEGNDIGGIDVGFLVKGSKAFVYSVEQLGRDLLWNDPVNGPSLLNDRPPLKLRAGIVRAGRVYPVTVILVHQRSLGSVEDTGSAGARVREKRKQQAEYLAGEVQAIQAASVTEPVVVLGDFNAFQFNDGYTDIMGIVEGDPVPADQVVVAGADLVNPDLFNLVTKLPPAERASYSFDGHAQVLDHVLVSKSLYPRVRHFAFAHANAFMPESYRADGTRPERLSDHDMPVVFVRYLGTQAPNVPVALSPGDLSMAGAVVNTATPTFRWSESLRAQTYQVQVVNATGNVIFTKSLPSAAACSRGYCSFTAAPMALGKTYRWHVRAVDTAGASAYTPFLKFRLQ